MEKTSILVLENKNYPLIANTLSCLAKSKNFEIHFLSRNASSPFRYSPLVKSHYYFPKDEPLDAFLCFAKLVTEKTKAKVLVPTDTQGFEFLINNRSQLQEFIEVIPVPSIWAFQTAHNKSLLAEFMQKNNISSPLTITNLEEDLEKKLEGFPFPVLLKPSIGSSGQGVSGQPGITFFEDKSTLLQFIEQHELGKNYIIQSYVDGYEIDCNALYKDGELIAYTIQKGLTKERQFAPCFGIEFIKNEEVTATVDALMSKLKWNGIAHIDLIYDRRKNQLMILEVNPRFWLTIEGSMVAANINFPALICMMALQKPINAVQYKLGKYIPFSTFIKYKIKVDSTEKINFKWREIDLHHDMAHVIPYLFRLYQRLINKTVFKKAK